MRALMRSTAFALLIGLGACAHDAAGKPGDKATAGQVIAGAPYAAVLADPARPQADKDRDADRKPADMLTFAGVKPGEKIGELLPGGGYFSRIFSKAVGPSGKVYAMGPAGQLVRFKAIADDKANYPNVQVVPMEGGGIKSPEPLDLVWTSQNYHDLKNLPAPFDINAYNKGVYDALKPGGLYIVLDHSAKPDAAVDVTNKLHRIQQDVVKKEVLAAGFIFVAEDNALRNPADKREKMVFDPSLRGKTDQFVMKFKKPG
ncbi:MAG: methyltransferase [Alphaproteobacteria bacterium]